MLELSDLLSSTQPTGNAVTDTISDLTRTRARLADEVTVYNGRIEVAGRHFQTSMHKVVLMQERQYCQGQVDSIDATLPVLIAAAGFRSGVRVRYPDAFLVHDHVNQVVGMKPHLGRIQDVIRALTPFTENFFGAGKSGPAFLGFRNLPNGDVCLVTVVTRYTEVGAYVGPEDQIRRLVSQFRMQSWDFPLDEAHPNRKPFPLLVRIHGPTGDPAFNPLELSRRVPAYVGHFGFLDSGWARLHETPRAVQTLSFPQVFQEDWTQDPQPPPKDVAWRASLVDITDWAGPAEVAS